MKKILLFLLSILILLLIIIIINTLRFNSKQLQENFAESNFHVSPDAVNHLAGAIRIRTISYDDESKIDISALDSLINYLQINYPLVFGKLNVRKINHSLLIKWTGNKKTEPVIFYAHLDVVPADTSTPWVFPPFGGITDSEYVYGRGTIDDKGSVIGILEAAEYLLKNNFTPSRDIYFAFGQDEEAGGESGAKVIAAELKSENVNAEFLLDEGGFVSSGMVPFIEPPVAMIFTSEKGYMSLDLTVKGSGGHSSFPAKDEPIEILSNAIVNIQQHPFETSITESVCDFMDFTGPEMKMPFRSLFANRWLFGGIIKRQYEKIPSANAMLRTTSVTTIINSGEKENVIPSIAKATINLRLLPGDNSKNIIEKIRSVINDDRVSVSVKGSVEEASAVSSHTSESFLMLQKTVKKVFPDAVVAPSLLIAQTDSRHFREVTKNIYRFLPVRMDDKILDTMHGNNEKIRISDFIESINFYQSLMSSL